MGRKRAHATPPSRGAESGAIRKSWHGRTRVCLVYPNTYRVGMSNLGFHAVYRLLNARDDVVCERAFLPADGAGRGLAAASVESGRPLGDFDLIAFSVSFENDYLHVLEILERAGLPLQAELRGSPHPLVLAGGVACFLNPEPLARFVEGLFMGEAVPLLDRFIDRNRELVLDRRVRLEFDRERSDRHGRRLAYVFLEDGTFVNQAILAAGYGFCLSKKPNTRYEKMFLESQRAAMEAGRGLWEGWSETGGDYVGNRESRLFHRPDCPNAKKISPRNRLRFDTQWEAYWSGYAPARECMQGTKVN